MASGRKCSISFSLFHFNFTHVPLERVDALSPGRKPEPAVFDLQAHFVEFAENQIREKIFSAREKSIVSKEIAGQGSY